MFLALGALIIASTKNPRTNLIINKAATGTLAVYLILTDTVASRLIGGAVGSLGLNGMAYMMFSLAVAMGVFVSCILFDLLRQSLMRPFRFDDKQSCGVGYRASARDSNGYLWEMLAVGKGLTSRRNCGLYKLRQV